MRTDTAKITAVLLASKKRPDGTCPVAVRVNWKGRAISTLPVSVTEKDWDAKNACVRKSVKNAANMNSIISQALAEADARRLEYEREGRSYTAADILSKGSPKGGYTPISEAVRGLVRDRSLRPNTEKGYITLLNWLDRWLGKGCRLHQLDSGNIRQFAAYLEDNGIKGSTIQNMLARVGSIYTWAAESGLASPDDHPMMGFRYRRKYRQQTERVALTENDVVKLEGWFASHFTADDGGTLRPASEEVWRDMLDYRSELFACGLWLASFYMQGLAPVDIACLTAGQFRERSLTRQVERMELVEAVVGGERRMVYLPVTDEEEVHYWAVEGVKRRKTGQPVELAVEIDYMKLAVIGLYLSTAAERGGYVWPIFRSGMTEDQRSYAMTRVSNTSCKRLKGLAGRLGIQGNVTPYVARHTYATMAAKSGVANAVLARSMGRTVGGIDRYVHSLTSAEALLDAKSRMR